jgi:transposase-like protein
MINIKSLIDEAKCYETVRQMRWAEGVKCPHCDSGEINKRGKDEREEHRQRYWCRECGRNFDDLTNTIFAGHHQPLREWIMCLYFMGLNLSNYQIAQELDLSISVVQQMTVQLRSGIVTRKPTPQLQGEIECDEVYVVAGHKGNPEAVKKKAEQVDAIDSKVPEVEEH